MPWEPNYVSKSTTQTHPLLGYTCAFQNLANSRGQYAERVSNTHLALTLRQKARSLWSARKWTISLNMVVENFSSYYWQKEKESLKTPLIGTRTERGGKICRSLPVFLDVPKECSLLKYAQVCRLNCQKCFNMNTIRPQRWEMFIYYEKGARRKNHCTYSYCILWD